ncbi:MAG TPA: preprotein translocase subunit YajC [Nitrospiria bacterium]|nr:preprotein translocase subunit YajC [Nitrospiria bacterium]
MIQMLSLVFAQESPSSPGRGTGAFFTSLLPFLLIFVLFYVLLILPQQRRQKKHRAMLEALKKGDRVVTSSGILGTIMNISKDTITLQVADNVKIRVLRDSISEMRKEEEGG